MEYDQDLGSTIEALTDRGFPASARCWDDPTVDWSQFDLVVVRSTWDYPERRAKFLDWAFSVEHIANPADVLEWNTDKHYLADLAAVGFPTVPTIWVDRTSDLALETPKSDLVVKPTVGAGGRGASRFGPDEFKELRDHVRRMLTSGMTAMVQPYLGVIDRSGERGLVFLGGRFSHAIFKPAMLARRGPPEATSLTVDAIKPAEATEGELEFAASVLDAVPGGSDRLLYARVDLAPADDGSPLLIELEVTEPNLYLNRSDFAPTRFAQAVEQWITRV